MTFGLSFGTAQYSARKEIASICDAKARQDLAFMLTYIDKELGIAEQAGKTFAAAVFRNGEEIPDSTELYHQEALFLEANPTVSSIMVGLEDRFNDAQTRISGGGQATIRRGEGLRQFSIDGSQDFRSLDWYNIAIHRETRRWCRPYMVPDGNFAITTYSIPLYNKSKHLMGVVGVNYRISRLDSILNCLKPYPNSVPSVVLNKDLTYVLHPLKDMVLNMDLKSEIQLMGDQVPDKLLEDIGARKTGKAHVELGGNDMTVYYAPVARAECSVLLFIDEATAQKSVAPNAKYRFLFSGIGLTIILVYLLSLSRVRRKKAKSPQASA